MNLITASLKYHHSLGYGWTILIAQELRADSLIAAVALLSDHIIAFILKILPCPALEV